MIRVNLLVGERKPARKKLAFGQAQRVTAGCALILIATVSAIGYRYWTLDRESTQLTQELTAAQEETTRLHSVIAQMQQFEQRKAQLQQRVTLIEQLRADQTGPVHMLDQISLALPATLWLVDMRQAGGPNEVLIEGRSLSLNGLSDFISNLEQSGYFQRSVEIVSSTTDMGGGPQGEVIRFQIKAVFKNPAAAKADEAPRKPSGD